MNRIISATLVVAMALSLVFCGSSGSFVNARAASAKDDAKENYSEKDITVIWDSLDSTEKATVRLYEDLPNVPYMSVTDFYNQFYLTSTDLKEGMSFEQDGSKYTVTNFCGDKAVFDVDADTITIDNMERFVKMACDLQSSNDDGLNPDYPYAQLTHSSDPEEAIVKEIKLSDYDIDLRGDETGVYAPLPTLQDIFASASGYYVVQAGEKIYVRDMVGLYFDSPMTEDPDYFEAVQADRPEDLAQFTYKELCLNMDLWYGKPGQEFIHDDLEKESMDQIISGKYPEIKEMLLASDFDTFFAGLFHVFNGLLFDGGHSGVGSDELTEMKMDMVNKTMKEVKAKDYGKSYVETGVRFMNGAIREEACEALYNGETYAEKGDTAIISIGKEFEVDTAGWKAFYAGEGELPTDDTVSVVLAGLERASKNPEIKNIIIDDSINGGGNDIAMLAIEWLMTGEGYVKDNNLITGQINTKEEVFDLNHDGKIDASDKSPYTKFNYGVLTSEGSFSCGNAFPFFMKDHGAMILGQKSSGGACAIRLSAVGGVEVRNSCATSCTVNDALETVDNGCPIDADLTTDGENPYVNFYDLDSLSEKMNEFFGEAKKDAA